MAATGGLRRDRSLLEEAARAEGCHAKKVRRRQTVDETVHKKPMDNFKDYDKVTIDGTIVEGKTLRERLTEELHEHMCINRPSLNDLH